MPVLDVLFFFAYEPGDVQGLAGKSVRIDV